MRPPLPAGLYGMADAAFGDPVALGLALARGGCRVVQLRAKDLPPSDRLGLARGLVQALAPLQTLVIVNDDVAVAKASGAHGLHLGQEDGDLSRARAELGPDVLIGRSTHDLGQVAAAAAEGADYIGFGPVFATSTKALADPVVGLSGLAAACASSVLPVVAIGGITLADLPAVQASGAHGWAVISDLLRYAEKGPDALAEAVADWLISAAQSG